jgi:hypothetical protein
MDPYLEQFWRDVHARLIIYAADQLRRQLPRDLRARVEERVFVESETAQRSMYPDIRIIALRVSQGGAMTTGASTVAEPLVLEFADEPVTERYIEIIDASSGRRVVTVIEVLSLSNKLPGEGQELYLRKQRELRDGRVSLVEIDLLRAGTRVLSVSPWSIPPSHRTTYQICVRRGWKPSAAEVYAVPLRARLSGVRVPLREGDTDATLDLQPLIDQCYENGGYDDDIDYRVEPVPPLDRDDAGWADELLRAKGKR